MGRHLSSHIIVKCIILNDFKGCATKSSQNYTISVTYANFPASFLPFHGECWFLKKVDSVLYGSGLSLRAGANSQDYIC